MAIIGISLLVASVVLFCLRPPAWLPNLLANLTQRKVTGPAPRPPIEQPEDEDDEPSTEDADVPALEEDAVMSLSPPPPPIIIQEPLVDIGVTDASDEDAKNQVHQIEDLREQDRTVEEMLEEEEGEEEQTTPKAAATARDEPIPSLDLPDLSRSSELSVHTAPQQPPPSSPPSFTMTPPPTFNIEPATAPEPVSDRGVDATPEQIAPSFTMPAPPPFNIEPATAPEPVSERGMDVAPPQIQPPQLNLVAPEHASSLAATSPQPNIDPAPPRKSPSDLMPPPPVPNSKLPKPRSSGIPLPASSSSPLRRVPSLTTAGRSSPTPSRLPSPPTAPRNISPTTTRIAKPNAPSPPGATGNRIPTLSGIPRRASPTPSSRNLPIPRRGGPSTSSGLMPPPTATSIPKKPSRQVSLQPGHSPLDWARLAQSPTSDLRNLPPNTPYLRVTPSMLKQQNGRKGNDAWSAFGGKVYNITPYIAFHPGGGPELLRGAGKDGTRLFAEVHPWVNYETMLQSCLIGLLVDESEAGPGAMEEMD
ncbi:hypothetical protein N0V93_003103 [Gnomoniopsis smithogilvyi]|uniref:Cytochrome b5 heme-binding domain-containing protein n=1 Tax=Gnomoniopsis smithogilvyi TaxID=1191159 RepID=A0A9W8YWH2_9PEZI|nr:hypothetical protein N0V93_003103 [Gnomoniopsis smithogilvyi]